MTSTDPWGRVAEDGTVYVRTAEGERIVGSWQAGAPEEALAFFRRKYDDLRTKVELLEQRLRNTDIAGGQALDSVTRLRGEIVQANAVGDLDSLVARLDRLAGTAEQRKVEQRQAQEEARTEARETKERIVAEAERVAEETTHWKSGGERMRQLMDEWKAAPRTDRATEQALWRRMSSARNAFSKRRKAYFANLDSERENIRALKEKIVTEAEAICDSTDWGRTAGRYRDLMDEWRSTGRADRASEDQLWARFKGAQDVFFQAREAAFSERRAELQVNADAKDALLTEAKKLLPVTDPREARQQLRDLKQRWDDAGEVPREARDRLEGEFRRIEDEVRNSEDKEWRRTGPAHAETMVAKLQASVRRLQDDLEKAKAAGDTGKIRAAEKALDNGQSLLSAAERQMGQMR